MAAAFNSPTTARRRDDGASTSACEPNWRIHRRSSLVSATRSRRTRLRVAETSELRRWILQFGSQAEVLAPSSLRRAVAEELKAAATAYRLSSARRRK